MHSFSPLFQELMSVALSLLTERRLEGEHAKIHQQGQHALNTNRKLPGAVSADLRKDTREMLFSRCDFNTSLEESWRQKPACIAKRLLSHLGISHAAIVCSSFSTRAAWIYMYDLRSQFQKQPETKKLIGSWRQTCNIVNPLERQLPLAAVLALAVFRRQSL